MIFAALLIALVVAVGLFEEADWHAPIRWLEAMDRAPLLALVAILPLFGFSIAVVYLVIGAVFGGWMGMAVVGGITGVHLLCSHWIAGSFLRGPLERYLKRRKKKLPEVPDGEEWAATLMMALVPGLPYFVRNYLLALSAIPLRTYFWICWPVYVLRSALVIMIGDFSGDFSWRRVGLLGAIYVVKLTVCGYLLFRLRARYKALHGSPVASPRPVKNHA